MSGTRILSDDQLDKMVELRERGWSYIRIAKHFAAGGTKVSQGSVAWQCLRLGADLPAHKRRPECGITKITVIQRGSTFVRRFTPDEDEKLLALDREGAPLSRMMAELGRKNNSIRGRLYTLALREARAEEAA